MNRIVSLRSLFAGFALVSFSAASVACAPVDAEGDAQADRTREASHAEASGAADDLSAPPPRPVVLKCVTSLGSYDGVTQTQCESLLKAAGCDKPGAVVGEKQKCSTASTDPAAPGGPDDITAPPSRPILITCVLPTGTHTGLTQAQCESLLTLSGCKPGAVVGDKQKCSTTEGAEQPGAGGPTDLGTPPPRPIPIKCILPTGTHEGLSQDQCEQLLKLSGCKPGAVLDDTQKCSTAG